MQNANPLSTPIRALAALLHLGAAGCGDRKPSAPAADALAPAPVYTYEVLQAWPHDRSAFTEGLTWVDHQLLESTGLNGESTLRKVDLATGQVTQRVRLPSEYFGEGSTVIGPRVFQLTWKNQKGFIYGWPGLEPAGAFAYAGEGWGLTTDGHSLIMSNGSNQIRFLDPATFQVIRSIDVFTQGRPLTQLNELEYVKGEILANIWQTAYVARIDPADGRLLGLIDFTGLLPAADRDGHEDVLNGIAYDAAGDRLFVTGKDWPKIFSVRLKRK